MTPPAVPDEHAGLVRDLVALAEQRAGDWFSPFEGTRPVVSLKSYSVRPRCFLYRFTLASPSARREIVAKVRHYDPQHRRADRYPDRPELTPLRTISDAEAAHLEYVGLNQIAAALQGADPQRLGVLRALAELPDRATVVMEYVDQPTLRQLLARPRARPGRRARGQLHDSVWAALGEWLSRFHSAHPGSSLPDRMTSSGDLANQLDRSVEFVARTGADVSRILLLRESAIRRLYAGWPAQLPSALGHGDFTAQNVFVAPEGTITIFDPLPLWRVCVFEDLARLTMGLRLLGPQAVTRGRLFSAAHLGRWESDLLAAYSGTAGPPRDLLHIYQAVLLLDRWCQLLGKRPQGGRGRDSFRKARVRIATGWFDSEAVRLTGLLG
jgi:aminoglycoside phosphotransferase (APT) family kinase protein